MKVRYISEMEFVPMNITHARRHNEVEDGLFQIVYGVMQYVPNVEICDLVVRLSKEQISETVKRFMLSNWKVEVEAILTKLKSFDVDNYRVVVVIPFANYVEDVSHTANRFQLVLFTINEILERGDAQMTTFTKTNYVIESKSIQELLGDSYASFMESLTPEEIRTKGQYYRCLFFDEMIRRGMTKFRSDFDGQEQVSLKPSQYFNQPEKFFDIMYYSGMEEWKKLIIKSELEELGDSGKASDSNNTSDKKGYTLGVVGTVFFMLKDLSKDAVDRKNKKKLVALMNYILDNKPDDDTARSYIDKLFGITAKSHSFKFYNRVKNNLGRFGFEVPEVVKEGWEKSRGNH